MFLLLVVWYFSETICSIIRCTLVINSIWSSCFFQTTYKLLCVWSRSTAASLFVSWTFIYISTGCFEFHGSRLELSGPFVTRFTPEIFFVVAKDQILRQVNRSESHLPGNRHVERYMKITVEISEISGRAKSAVPVLLLFLLFPATGVTEGFGILVGIFPCNISQHQHHYKNTNACTHHWHPKTQLTLCRWHFQNGIAVPYWVHPHNSPPMTTSQGLQTTNARLQGDFPLQPFIL